MSFKTESCSTKSVWSQPRTITSSAVLVSCCLTKYNCIFEPVVKLHISYCIPAFEPTGRSKSLLPHPDFYIN